MAILRYNAANVRLKSAELVAFEPEVVNAFFKLLDVGIKVCADVVRRATVKFGELLGGQNEFAVVLDFNQICDINQDYHPFFKMVKLDKPPPNRYNYTVNLIRYIKSCSVGLVICYDWILPQNFLFVNKGSGVRWGFFIWRAKC